jgi:hypothetical protein
MRLYMKAYYLKDLRKFVGWTEQSEPLADDAIVYLGDDFVVTKDVFDDSPVVFAKVTEEWKRFCAKDLAFQPPSE